MSLEILNLYLNRFPGDPQLSRMVHLTAQLRADSLYAINIKACNHYKLYNGSAAEVEEGERRAKAD